MSKFSTRFIRVAQAPPGPPPSGPGGPPPPPPTAPPGGAPPPPMLGMGGPPPTAPTAAPGGISGPDREEIGSALDSLDKILYDIDIQAMIENDPTLDPDDLAVTVFKMYGGDEFGNAIRSKVGKRDPHAKNVSPEDEKAEQERTEDKRWERLPLGQHITDIQGVTLDKLTQFMPALIASVVANVKKQAGGGAAGGPPGPGGPLASSNAWIKIANNLDQQGCFKQADWIDKNYIV